LKSRRGFLFIGAFAGVAKWVDAPLVEREFCLSGGERLCGFKSHRPHLRIVEELCRKRWEDDVRVNVVAITESD
jgi:hypothetical protein